MRALLLKSRWFVDAVGSAVSADEVATCVYQPNGCIALPPLTCEARPKDVENVMKYVQNRLGLSGRQAMSKYIECSGLSSDSAIGALLAKYFPLESEPGSGGSGTSGRGRPAPAGSRRNSRGQ